MHRSGFFGAEMKDSFGKPSADCKIQIEEQVLPSATDAIEFGMLKKELDFYKMHLQILQQKNSMLEEQLELVTNTCDELKKEVSSASLLDSSIEELDGHQPTDDSDDSSFTFTFGSGQMWRSNSFGSWRHSSVRPTVVRSKSSTLPRSPPDRSQVSDTSEFIPRTGTPAFVANSSEICPAIVRSKSSTLPRSPPDRRMSDTSEFIPRTRTGTPAFVANSSEICQHFLKGRCRYKSLCKYSHEVTQCPHCEGELPLAKIAASTHLSRCYKLHSGTS